MYYKRIFHWNTSYFYPAREFTFQVKYFKVYKNDYFSIFILLLKLYSYNNFNWSFTGMKTNVDGILWGDFSDNFYLCRCMTCNFQVNKNEPSAMQCTMCSKVWKTPREYMVDWKHIFEHIKYFVLTIHKSIFTRKNNISLALLQL